MISPLTVSSLLGTNLRQHAPFLAYLSACGTGQVGDAKYFDENIHLISGFQLAGFRHVIGTLWTVEDERCLDISRTTYQKSKLGSLVMRP
jgi:CHAT domain-containing protein